MKRLIVATKNQGKLREIRELLKDFPVEVVCLSDDKNFPEIIEDGKTFRANALKKALTISTVSGALVLGEDSGIEVAALNNRPGVFSARYAGSKATDKKNNLKLLCELKGIPSEKRCARYRCVAVLAEADKIIAVVSGSCEGLIAERSKGKNGFGYDPLFFVPRYQQTFGELDPLIKSKISHRAKAMRKMKKVLKDYFQNRSAG